MDPIFSLIERTPAFAVLSSDIGGGRLGHAYLFAGDEVSAEAMMLLGAARALCPEGGCQKCATCRRILAGIHPDVLSFPEGGKYTAEGMEALIAEIYRRPTEGEKKFLLLKGADSMNLTCQNKFLKTLEEPPGDCHLFLGAAREDALLPTVRSRVRRLEIPPFSAEQLLPFARAVCRPEEAELFAALGQGSPSEVRKLAEGRGRELFELALTLLNRCRKVEDAAYFSGELTARKEDFLPLCDILSLLLSDALKEHCGAEGQIKGLTAEQNRWKKQFSNAALAEIIRVIKDCRKRLTYNAGFAYTADALLFALVRGRS